MGCTLLPFLLRERVSRLRPSSAHTEGDFSKRGTDARVRGILLPAWGLTRLEKKKKHAERVRVSSTTNVSDVECMFKNCQIHCMQPFFPLPESNVFEENSFSALANRAPYPGPHQRRIFNQLTADPVHTGAFPEEWEGGKGERSTMRKQLPLFLSSSIRMKMCASADHRYGVSLLSSKAINAACAHI